MGKLAGPFIGWGQWAPCAANWPGHATERYTGPWNAKTKTPILLINNTYDPATGYPGAQHAERLLRNAVLLTVAGYGHPFRATQQVRRHMASPLPRASGHPAAGDGLRSPAPVPVIPARESATLGIPVWPVALAGAEALGVAASPESA